MLRIGLTGGIGSGKSTVAKIFALLGAPVYFADHAAKRLYKTHEGLKAALRRHFGDDIYAGDELDRARLASIVFHDPAQLELLNSLVHPLTIADAKEWMQRQQAPYVVKEAALLFESGSATGLDYVIGVRAPYELRLKRAQERDGITARQVLERAAHQIDDKIKMRLCDFILENDEQQLLIPQVLELHEELVERSKS